MPMKKRLNNLENKKIAFVHDSIVEYGGGERVLELLPTIFPAADYYTSVIDLEILRQLSFSKQINSSWIQNLPHISKYPRLIQLLSPIIWPTFNVNKYDIVITHGGFYLSHLVNLSTNSRESIRIHYSLTPPKNLYYSEHTSTADKLLSLYYPLLRYLEKLALERTNCIWTNSKHVSDRILKIYNRKSRVLYPPVKVPELKPSKNTSERKVFCYIGRITREKRVEIIVDAFNYLKLPILIIGQGKHKEALKKKAKKNIKFLDFVSDEKIEKILTKCSAFIHASIEEDFGIAPVEAMARGVPVIAHSSGGIQETIIDGKTGILYHGCTYNSLIDAVNRFKTMRFDPYECYKQAGKFHEKYFRNHIVEYLLDEL